MQKMLYLNFNKFIFVLRENLRKNLLLTIISYVKNLISCFKNFLKKMI